MCCAQRAHEVPSSCYARLMKPTRKSKAPIPTPKEAQERYALLDGAARKFQGQLDELESALGMYIVGYLFGWKVLHLVHSKKTVAKYEAVLGIKVTEVFEAVGPDAERTNAFKIIQTVSNFWKVVSGEEKVSMDRDTRRSIM